VSFLIDTDTCSAHLRQRNAVTSRFLQYMGRLHISVVTLGELFTWAMRANAPPRRMESLERLLADVEVLDLTATVAQEFGRARAKLMDIGRPAPDLDLLIAATALAHGLTLVTHNTRDFANVPDLNVVDWLTP
jgi:tRNA(fMet)-specific endonuclease VapC